MTDVQTFVRHRNVRKVLLKALRDGVEQRVFNSDTVLHAEQCCQRCAPPSSPGSGPTVVHI